MRIANCRSGADARGFGPGFMCVSGGLRAVMVSIVSAFHLDAIAELLFGAFRSAFEFRP